MYSSEEVDDEFNFGFLPDEVVGVDTVTHLEHPFSFDLEMPEAQSHEESIGEEYNLSTLNLHELPRIPVENLPPTPLPGTLPLHDSFSPSYRRSDASTAQKNGSRQTIGQCLASVLDGNRDNRFTSSLPAPLSRAPLAQEVDAGKASYPFGRTSNASNPSPLSSEIPAGLEGGAFSYLQEGEQKETHFGKLNSALKDPTSGANASNGLSNNNWKGNEYASSIVDKWRPPRKPRCTFTHGEVKIFYDALSKFGTDFNLMALLFPKRDRNDLKKLYHRELKKNPQNVSAALGERRTFDEVDLHQRIKERHQAMAAEPLRMLEKEEEAYLREIEDETLKKDSAGSSSQDRASTTEGDGLNTGNQNVDPTLSVAYKTSWEEKNVPVQEKIEKSACSDDVKSSGQTTCYLQSPGKSPEILGGPPPAKRNRHDSLLVDVFSSLSSSTSSSA